MAHESNILPQGSIPLVPSTLEDIDAALSDWVKELNIHCTTNKGWVRTPVLWSLSEKSFQIKSDQTIRDKSGTLILPLISVERTDTRKDPSKKGMFWGHIDRVNDFKGGSIEISHRINQDKTSNFTNAQMARRRQGVLNFPNKQEANEKIVYQIMSIPMPSYVENTYKIHIMTDYQQQMNEIVTPFISKTGGINYFTMRRNGHIYAGFIQEGFTVDNRIGNSEKENRQYKTEIEIKVLGYLMGEDKNQAQPHITIRENFVNVSIKSERSILEESPEWKNGKYYV